MGFESTYLWEDPIQSGVIFGSVFASLISICYYSLISVCAYGSLTALLAVLSLKVYTYVMVTFLKKEVPCNPLAKVAGKSKKNFNFFKYLGEKYHMYVRTYVSITLLIMSWLHESWIYKSQKLFTKLNVGIYINTVSTGNIETPLSHTHSIVCANTYF